MSRTVKAVQPREIKPHHRLWIATQRHAEMTNVLRCAAKAARLYPTYILVPTFFVSVCVMLLTDVMIWW